MRLFELKEQFKGIETPFYYYDKALMEKTLDEALKEASSIPTAMLHYAVKANNNPYFLSLVREKGMGVDCVSGGEIQLCLDAGIPGNRIMFAGVGKTDREIQLALNADILSFNAESVEEIELLNEIAHQMGKKAHVAIRINPDIDAHTHKNITTGLADNKFGISLGKMMTAIQLIHHAENLSFFGLHFHIGSQILNLSCFYELCQKINSLQDKIEAAGFGGFEHIDVGGGLGVDYENPLENPMPDFHSYFQIFKENLKLRPSQKLHFELGRALTAQWGALITHTTLVKQGESKQFAIVDAGMTDLIRPALYQARHKIINLSNTTSPQTYDVAGPICESSDVFAENITLPEVRRGDLLAILSAGAYGRVMSLSYNTRQFPKEYVM